VLCAGLCVTSRSLGHLAVVKGGLRITRILWMHSSLGCLSVANEFWSQRDQLHVGRCVDSSFGCGHWLSMAGISGVCIGVVSSVFLLRNSS